MQIPEKSDILTAHGRIKEYINKTPILSSRTFNQMFGADFLFKCENFQKTGSFKARGAVNAVFTLSDKDLKNGVATHSSGNHAQALAYAASLKKVKAFTVMPLTASEIKIKAVKGYGGNVTFCEPTLDSRKKALEKVIAETGALEIHPYDKFEIVAGQATAAKELIEEYDNIDLLLAPVGGGGLLSGTSLAAKYFGKNIKVIGCEPAGADDAYKSFKASKIIPSVNPQTIADGLLTSLGKINFEIIKNNVHDIVTVSEDSIKAAMRLIWERMKIIIEPSSAVPFAAIIEGKVDVRGKNVGIIISGGNVDLNKSYF